MAVTQITIYSALVDNSRLGYEAVSFDSMVSTTAPVIKAGSKLEMAGALFTWGADETPVIGSPVNGTVYYLYLGTSPSTASYYSATAPTWDNAKQGYYSASVPTNRCYARVTWATGAVYSKKYIYGQGGGVPNPTSVTGGMSFIGVPIGVVLPWHKSLAGTPALPDGWLELNGQTVNDPDSPYNGQTLPDYETAGYFIRGGATSGTLQAQGTAVNGLKIGSGTVGGSIPGLLSSASLSSATPSNAFISGDAETRPINVSMCFIMRIK